VVGIEKIHCGFSFKMRAVVASCKSGNGMQTMFFLLLGSSLKTIEALQVVVKLVCRSILLHETLEMTNKFGDNKGASKEQKEEKVNYFKNFSKILKSKLPIYIYIYIYKSKE